MEKSRLLKKALNENILNVRFINPVPKAEVFKFILASDMGTSVLKNVETFKTVYSNKSFDYMACKKPILMAIDGVSRELVEKADAGIYVQPENPEDFAQKVQFYLFNSLEVNRQGENGYKFAKTNFDRIVLAKKYIQLIQEKLYKL
jgi:glycosyltransferase involved in cell wall biosynthesis